MGPDRSARSVMLSWSTAFCILILQTTTFVTGSDSAGPVKVKLHESATLPCSERCSESVRWTMSQNPTEVLAECDQTSCRSVKEGYQMIHDQYLKGDLSLTITDTDLSKRGWYTCDCDGTDLRDVELQVEPLITTAHMKTGESLLLKLDVPDPVEVLYNGTDPAGPSSVSICTVSRSSVECIDQYEQRVSFNSGLELRGVTPSDSGVYTIRNMDEEVLYTYTVTVQDRDAGTGAAIPVLSIVPILVLVVVSVLAVTVYQRRKKQQLQLGSVGNGDVNHVQEDMQMNKRVEETLTFLNQDLEQAV